MRAVVLAAGEGRRLRNVHPGPKPLFPLLGLPLIVRTFCTLREAGIADIVVVLGHRGDEVRAALGDGSRWGVRVTYAENPEWEKGNGASVLAAAPHVAGERSWLLLMADHLVTPELVKRVAACTPPEGGVAVGVDFAPARVPDLDEATKVQTDRLTAREAADGGAANQDTRPSVVAIGKDLATFDGVDCGVFHATSGLLDALRACAAEGRHTLSDGVRRLAAQGRAVACDIGDARWCDVDDAAAVHHARRLLLEQLPTPRDGLISRHLNRKLSVPISAVLARFSVTPNQLSFATFLLTALAAGLFAAGAFVAGGVVAQVASVLDGVDGEIARLKFLRSRFGELFDAILDRIGDGLLLAGLTYGTYVATGSPWALLFGALALIGSPLSMMIKDRYRAMTGDLYRPDVHDGWVRYLLANRDGRMFVLFLGGILEQGMATLAVLAFTSLTQAVVRLARLKKFL
ncbi:MAG TPA: NTP transferase domain-containing protein [Calditerricola sp.]